jgi:hypothetical protein
MQIDQLYHSSSENEARGKTRVWNSKLVEECARNIEEGIENTHGTPFYENDPSYKKGDIVFEYTEDEIRELTKCQTDVVYFANTHCVAMTDEGVQKIKLRDYQRKILDNFQKHRFNVFLASRQIGKCISPITKVCVKNAKTGKEEELFVFELLERKLKESKDCRFIDRVRFSLYRRMAAGKSYRRLLSILEKWENKDLKLTAEDKIINTYFFEETEYYVSSDEGWVPISQIHMTRQYQAWKVTTESGNTVTCADDHLFFTNRMKAIKAQNLRKGMFICTEEGYDRVISVQQTEDNFQMFDLSVESGKHRYYTNGVLSHNTVTSAMYITWFLIFNIDKNVMVLANKGATCAEIIDKIKMSIKGIPFFMKPGVKVNNQLKMSFDNGCRLMGQSTTKTAAIGFTIHLAYLDEFAHIHRNFIESFYRSVYPTISSSAISRIIITSTPNGKNKFWEIYQGAIENNNEYNPIRVDWWEVPGRDEAWKKREIGNLGSEELFNQEYGNQFIASDTLLLNSDRIKLMIRNSKDFTFQEIGSMEDAELNYRKLKWIKGFDLDAIDKEKDRFAIVIDLSDGIGRDNAVINILKVEPLSIAAMRKIRKDRVDDESSFFRARQIGIFKDNKSSPEDIARITEKLVFDVFGDECVKVVVEWNFKGELFVKEIEKNENFYEDILLHTRHSSKAKYASMGVKIEKHNKVFFCKELARLIGEKRIIVCEKDSVSEFTSFGINERGTYSAQAGYDDIAMTFVDLVALIKSDTFAELISEIIDQVLTAEAKKIIFEKIEESAERDDFSWSTVL